MEKGGHDDNDSFQRANTKPRTKVLCQNEKEGEENRVGTPHGKSMHRAVAAPGSTRRPFSPNTINAGVEDSEAEGQTGDANEFRLHQDELERLETKLLHLLGCNEGSWLCDGHQKSTPRCRSIHIGCIQ